MNSKFEINQDALVMGQPLFVEQIGYVEQPKVENISIIGYESYTKLLSPLFIRVESPDDADSDDETLVFDIYFEKGNEQLKQAMINALSLFFRKDIEIKENIVFIGSEGILHKYNFAEFQRILMAMFGLSEQKKEDLSKLNEKQLAIKKKLEYHRKRHADKNKPTFKQILNTVIHRGHFDYDVVSKMSYYQLLNSYLVISGLNAYDEYVLYKASPKFEIKDEMEHWTKTIKKI